MMMMMAWLHDAGERHGKERKVGDGAKNKKKNPVDLRDSITVSFKRLQI